MEPQSQSKDFFKYYIATILFLFTALIGVVFSYESGLIPANYSASAARVLESIDEPEEDISPEAQYFYDKWYEKAQEIASNKFLSTQVSMDQFVQDVGPTTKARINGNEFIIEVAVSLDEQEKGLSIRQTLPENRGMLFLFPKKSRYPFWMKGMNFSLDMVWMDGDKIVDITKGAKPSKESEPPIIKPSVKADKVLEINAGLCDKFGIAIGDTIAIDLP